MAIGKLDEAAHNLDSISPITRPPRTIRSLYQKGRLLFMQDDFKTLSRPPGFHSGIPASSFVPASWFWAGESFSARRLDDALAVYTENCFRLSDKRKLEAHNTRFPYRAPQEEIELTKLLKWSHEDFLKSIEEYRTGKRRTSRPSRPIRNAWPPPHQRNDKQTIASLQQDLAKKQMKQKPERADSGLERRGKGRRGNLDTDANTDTDGHPTASQNDATTALANQLSSSSDSSRPRKKRWL